MGFGNLVPRHGHLTINRGRPSDGLQAWCVLRGIDLPRPPRGEPPKGVRGTLSQPVTPAMLFDLLIVVGFELLVFAHVIAEPVAIAAVLAFLTRAAWARGSVRGPVAARRSPRIEPLRPASVPMKTCPSCGAQVQHLAKLCYCYHPFD